MKVFIKADNYTSKFLLLITLIADIALIVFGMIDKALKTSLVIAGVLTVIVMAVCLIDKNEGLLIEDDKLCYKSIGKKYYEPNQIAGLLIVKDQLYLGKLISINLRIKGEYKYKIIYLKDRNFEKSDIDEGVYDFSIKHRKNILFTTVYDEKAVEYFTSKGISVMGEAR